MKLDTEAELKKALREKKFDARLREATVRFSREATVAGKTITDTALRLGMKANTLQRWHQRAGKARGPAVDFVEVSGAASVDRLEVVWPTGHLVRVGAGD